MQEAICHRCSKKIHRSMSGTWYDEGGFLCGTRSSTSNHDPEEDAYTEAQIRAAWKKMAGERQAAWEKSREKWQGGDDNPGSAIDVLMEKLAEPEYPACTVWKDRSGVYWYRSSDNNWMRFGHEARYDHDRPARPLRQMKVAE